MIKPVKISLATLAILLLTAACAGSATPVFPTLSVNDVATVVAATMLAVSPQNTPTFVFATPVPNTPIPPTFPVVPPTAIPPAATRINFLTGATEGIVSGPIQTGQTLYYVLQAAQGQPMIVSLEPPVPDMFISVATQGGTALLSAASKQPNWQGMLPQTEDYYIGIYDNGSPQNYSLQVITPARIQIAQGATKAVLSGKTVAGYDVIYTAFGLQGQILSVDLNGVGSNAALTIYGFADGQPYVRSVTGQTSFSMKLPSSQDYIIQVVPRAGMVVNYTLVVKFQ